MTGYERVVEYLTKQGFKATLKSVIETGPEGDDADYDRLVDVLKQFSNESRPQVPLPALYELTEAAEQLLAWQPVCSLGSSGDLRQRRLRNALDRFKGVS